MFSFFKRLFAPPAPQPTSSNTDSKYHFDQNYHVDPRKFLDDVLVDDAFTRLLAEDLGGARVKKIEPRYPNHYDVTVTGPRWPHPVVLYVGVIPTSFSMAVAIAVFQKDNPGLREKVNAEGHAHTWDHTGAVDAFREAFRMIEEEMEK